MKLLVTAGPTCEDLDDVRCLTNRSSGRMGYAVAAEALRRGHEVELVTGPAEISPPAGAKITRIRSALDLLAACRGLFPSCDAMVATAAVADYRPAERLAGKLKKSAEELLLRLIPNLLLQLKRKSRQQDPIYHPILFYQSNVAVSKVLCGTACELMNLSVFYNYLLHGDPQRIHRVPQRNL